MSYLPLGPWHLIANFGASIVTFLPTTVTVAGEPGIFAPLARCRLPLYVPGATAAAAADVSVAAPMSATTPARTLPFHS